jgi:hypothetical protein
MRKRPVQSFVLVIEPREPERHRILQALTSEGWAAVGCGGTRDAREVLRVARPALVVAYRRHANRLRELRAEDAPSTVVLDDGTATSPTKPVRHEVATLAVPMPFHELLAHIRQAAHTASATARSASSVRPKHTPPVEDDADNGNATG